MSDQAKPIVILSPGWRVVDELFSTSSLRALNGHFDVVWGRDGNIPQDLYDRALPEAFALVSAQPQLTRGDVARARNLRAVIEVSGTFPKTIDYAACAEAGIEVLSCSPGFRRAVAEMGLAMLLAGARGLVDEHEAFRTGAERWLDDRPETDFSLYGSLIGFVGFGRISQEMTRLLAPFSTSVLAHDPFLPREVADSLGAKMTSLEELVGRSRAVVVAAAATKDNKHLIGREILAMMPDHTLVVLLSRAHLLDMNAMMAELEDRRLRLATDVFPAEPLAGDHPIRRLPNVILSPHRAAAVDKGRQPIGEMILHDLRAVAQGDMPATRLARAKPVEVDRVAGIGDATGSRMKGAERDQRG